MKCPLLLLIGLSLMLFAKSQIAEAGAAVTTFPRYLNSGFDTAAKASVPASAGEQPFAQLSPNPSPYFRVRAGSSIGRPSQVTVNDVNGKVWYDRSVPSGEVISFGGDFPNGIYFIRIRSGFRMRIIKAVKTAD